MNVLWLLFFFACQCCCMAEDSVNIGVFSNNENNQLDIALEYVLLERNKLDQNVFFKSKVKNITNVETFDASKILCEVLKTDDGVAAVISHGSSSASAGMESICSHFRVPYITTSWRSPTPNLPGTVLNFFPEAKSFAHALAEVVKSLRWRSFAIVYGYEEGLVKMKDILRHKNFKDSKILIKQLRHKFEHRPLLKEINSASEKNIILDCKTEDIIPILKQAKELNLLNPDNNYFITSLDAHTLDYSELDTAANITTIRLFDYNSEAFKNITTRWNLQPNQIITETVLFHDALLDLTDSINHLIDSGKNITGNTVRCYEHNTRSKYGNELASHMKNKKRRFTMSGPLEFSDRGNRMDFNLQVVDILGNKVIADWYASNVSLVLRRDFNEMRSAASANLQTIVVNVSSRLGVPYLMLKEPEDGEILYGNDRFEGYSIDLIHEIAKLIGFRFIFHLTADGQYGRWDEKNQKWTGLIGDIVERRAELAICDLTITHQRREVVDFSIPFMTLGISILYQTEEVIPIFNFLNPFLISVWIYAATLYLIISVVLYFIARISPGDWENPHPYDENPDKLENIWDIKNCLWLTLGSIMTQGCHILPKGISSRIAVLVWWFFAIILASSYTAKLAAFLTAERLEPTIDSVEALAEQTKVKYGTVDGGSTMAFFKSSSVSTYERMWANMISSTPSVFERSNSDGVIRVQKSNGRYAFLMESTQIDYEVETKCDLTQVGGFLDTKSYGIAMPLDAPYKSYIDKAILMLQGNGKLNDLKYKWWKIKRTEPSCEKSDTEELWDSADLTLADVGGVFLVVGVGIVMAILLAISEFLWNVRKVSAEDHLTYLEALKLELNFACKVWITKKRAKPDVVENDKGDEQQNHSE